MAICKIFDPYPKSTREDFFDAEEILDEVEKLVQGKFWPLLLGPKRTGKTSILKIVANELDGIYIDATNIKSIKQFGEELLVSTTSLKLTIDLKLIRLEIDKSPIRGVRSLIQKLNEKIILVDEVQNVISPWFLTLLSNVYNESEIRFVFTGSMIGFSKTLLGQGKGKVGNVLKGRPIIQIEVMPFSEELGKEFLRYGSNKCKIELTDEEIEESVRSYRGIQGWLTYYGSFRSIGYSHQKAMDMVKKVAEGIIREEVARLSETQRMILRALCLVEHISWKELKNLTEGLAKRELKDWVFNHALMQLINARIVKKNDRGYLLIDPLYKLVLYR